MSFTRAKAALAGTRFGDLRSVAQTGSTNADMHALLADTPGADGAIVLLADHQTAGRGRLSRTWQAPPGASILMSIGVPVAGVPAERRGLLSTALALATTDAIGAVGGTGEVLVKWPNDVVVEAPDDAEGAGPGYRKLGGILAELHPIEGRGDCLVLGLGLNVNWPEIPEELASIATSLHAVLGTEVDRDDLVTALLGAFEDRWLPLVEAPDGDLAELFAAYTDRSATLGRQVRVELPSSTLTGRAVRVLPDGALVVAGDDGTEHTVTVGDVVHLRPA